MTEDCQQKPYEIIVLDDLIDGCYGAILETLKKDAKLGDLLKMIELRRKLTPNEEEQKQFWSMLESVRQKHLAKSDCEKNPIVVDSAAELMSKKDDDDHK